jgi:nucleotide-binding universal stress UspA family protein
MALVRNIMVPVDFSAASKNALRYACSLAEALGASLRVVHVTDNPFVPGGYMEFYAPPVEFFDRADQQAREELEALLTPEEKARYRAVLVHRSGLAAQELLAYLEEEGDVDLVIMATHGRGGVARLMMGSVADKLVRAAPCPVLTLRGEAAARSSTQAA